MPIIKAHKPDPTTKGGASNVTICSTEATRMQSIADLKEEGYTNIHDAETGENFDIL